MDKKLSLKLNGGRCVQGILRGFDPFMNVVMDEGQEVTKDGKKSDIGMVVSKKALSWIYWISLNLILCIYRSSEETV